MYFKHWRVLFGTLCGNTASAQLHVLGQSRGNCRFQTYRFTEVMTGRDDRCPFVSIGGGGSEIPLSFYCRCRHGNGRASDYGTFQLGPGDTAMKTASRFS